MGAIFRARHVALQPLLGEASPTKIDYRKKVGTLILTSLLEDIDTSASQWQRLLDMASAAKPPGCLVLPGLVGFFEREAN